jgi:hypothetical protein
MHTFLDLLAELLVFMIAFFLSSVLEEFLKMKDLMKKVIVLASIFTCVSLFAFSASAQHSNDTERASSQVEKDSFTPINLDRYLEEVSLSDASLTRFFKCYNNPFYARRFLPSCFVHINDFLKFLPGQTDPWSYTTTIFSMFLTKLKGCIWTNSFALADLLESLPQYLQPLAFTDKFRQELKDQLRQKVVLFAVKDPNECVEILMTDFDRYHDVLNKMTECQCEVTRFLDTSFDRLIWDPADDKVVWESFKRLGKALTGLADQRIISIDNCNEIVWSLLHSFTRFLNVAAIALRPAWYEHVLKEIESQPFLRGDEVDPAMETKKTYLTKAVKLGYAQTLMVQKNLVVPQN